MTTYLLGALVRVSAAVTDDAGHPVDPATLHLLVTDPAGNTTPYNTPAHDGTGAYHQDIPTAAIGRYTYDWVSTGTIAVGNGSFLVAGDDGTLSITDGPNALWCSASDVLNRCGKEASSIAPDVALDSAVIASNAMFVMSGRQFLGSARTVFRPCARPRWAGIGAWSSWFMSMTGSGWIGAWGIDYDPDGAVAAMSPPEVDLGVYPLIRVNEVKIDGVVIPSDEYRIDGFRTLVRCRPSINAVPTERYGWPCFPAGTLIQTDTGLVPIQDVSPGMTVLTHRGRWRRVVWAAANGEKETVTLAGRGGQLTCTPDHPIWAREITREHRSYKLGTPDWCNATNMVGSAWAMPKTIEALPTPLPDGWAFSDLPANFWWVVGRWIGDGWTESHSRPTNPGSTQRRPSKGILICCGLHEADDLRSELANTGWHWAESIGPATHRFRVGNAALWAWLREYFGVGARNKRIPAWLLAAPIETRQSFLDGYRSADGSTIYATHGVRNPYYSIGTVSRELAFGCKALIASLGFAPMLYQGPIQSPWGSGAGVHYRINWPIARPGEPFSQAWTDDDHLWGRVRSIRLNQSPVTVYDLEVEEDHSFVADGFVVHNCWQNLALPPTEPGTWSADVTWGMPPPPFGVNAATVFAAELAKARSGLASALPQRVLNISRQGVSVAVRDPMEYLAAGFTGMYEVDLFLRAYNPSKARKRPRIWSPDMDRVRHTTGG